MKQTAVPAQITTVEDKVAANLSMTQLVILAMPLFLDVAFYIILPPFITLGAYKIIAFILIDPLIAAMAIRFNGEILVNWLIVLTRYRLRPRIYVYDKNSTYARTLANESIKTEKADLQETDQEEELINLSKLTPEEVVKASLLLSTMNYELNFLKNKGADVNVQVVSR
jgi:hypothetical protein